MSVDARAAQHSTWCSSVVALYCEPTFVYVNLKVHFRWLWPTLAWCLPCLMIGWCLHLLEVMFCLPVLSAWWIVDAWLHVLCARNRKAWRESTAWWWLQNQSRFLNTVFLPIFFLFSVAHDFRYPSTRLPSFFLRLKVLELGLQSDLSVGLANPTHPDLLATRYVRCQKSKTSNKRTAQKLSMCKVDPITLVSFARSWFCDRIR